MDKYLNFNDIFKKGFLKVDMFEKIPASQVLLCMTMTLVVAIFIFYIYKYTFRGVVYSYTFNVSLVIMCLLTALIILTISSNVVLSLGMVGALSIVRFRTALKDPMDIMFMFWAISIGIASGAGIYSVSIVGSLFTGVVILIMANHKVKERKYMLIIHFNDEAYDKVRVILQKLKYILKSKTITKNMVEMTVEVKVKGANTAFVNELSEISGVVDASLVTYNGDYAD